MIFALSARANRSISSSVICEIMCITLLKYDRIIFWRVLNLGVCVGGLL